MTTPTKAEIEARPRELWHEDRAKNGDPSFDIEPEPSELAESGFISAAKGQLMQDRHRAMIEEYFIDEESKTEPFSFDSKEAMQTTSFISGSRGVGKSDIAMYITDQLMNEGITVIAFDPSRDWLQRSAIRQYVSVKPYSVLPIPEDSTIFDISLLTPMQAQQCVERFCRKLFNFQLNSERRFYLVFEECQTFFPLNALRSKKTQNSMRILTVGRNIDVSICAISQFPSVVDKELVKHSGQIWIGYTTELNTLKYWKGILGNNVDRLKELENGQFVYYHRNKISLTEIEAYHNTKPKIQITIPEAKPIEPMKPKQNHDTTKALTSVAISFLWLVAIIMAFMSRPI